MKRWEYKKLLENRDETEKDDEETKVIKIAFITI